MAQANVRTSRDGDQADGEPRVSSSNLRVDEHARPAARGSRLVDGIGEPSRHSSTRLSARRRSRLGHRGDPEDRVALDGHPCRSPRCGLPPVHLTVLRTSQARPAPHPVAAVAGEDLVHLSRCSGRTPGASILHGSRAPDLRRMPATDSSIRPTVTSMTEIARSLPTGRRRLHGGGGAGPRRCPGPTGALPRLEGDVVDHLGTTANHFLTRVEPDRRCPHEGRPRRRVGRSARRDAASARGPRRRRRRDRLADGQDDRGRHDRSLRLAADVLVHTGPSPPPWHRRPARPRRGAHRSTSSCSPTTR